MSESIESARSHEQETLPGKPPQGVVPESDSHAGDPDAHHEHEAHPFLAHHFDTPKHQFESGKLGIWIFLVTEVLFFAGLFCAYSVYRGMHPEVFYWAHFYLDTNLGAVNTIVLIVSSFTAAWAVRNAQLGQQRMLVTNIAITLACALTFMGVKYVEYSHKFHDGLLWGGRKTAEGADPEYRFDPHHPVWELSEFEHKHPAAASAAKRLHAAAHPEDATDSGERNDPSATLQGSASLSAGTASANAAPSAIDGSTPAAVGAGEGGATGEVQVAGGGTGGNTESGTAGEQTRGAGGASIEVSDDEAAAALALLAEMAGADTGEVDTNSNPAPSTAKEATKAEDPLRGLTDEELVPLVRAGVLGPDAVNPTEPSHPKLAHVFFGIYFFMTGLHGIHVVGGIVVWLWLLRRALRGEFGPKYFGPIDYAALYWHLVDLVWIYLFPLLYLIH